MDLTQAKAVISDEIDGLGIKDELKFRALQWFLEDNLIFADDLIKSIAMRFESPPALPNKPAMDQRFIIINLLLYLARRSSTCAESVLPLMRQISATVDRYNTTGLPQYFQMLVNVLKEVLPLQAADLRFDAVTAAHPSDSVNRVITKKITNTDFSYDRNEEDEFRSRAWFSNANQWIHNVPTLASSLKKKDKDNVVYKKYVVRTPNNENSSCAICGERLRSSLVYLQEDDCWAFEDTELDTNGNIVHSSCLKAAAKTIN